jgi:ribosomal protein L16/L10AE
MIECNVVPQKLKMVSRKAYTQALYAVNTDLELCQHSADKIISKYADRLWDRFQIRWIPTYNEKLRKNKNATRKCKAMGEYTLRSARGGHRRGYHSIQDVITNVRKYS